MKENSKWKPQNIYSPVPRKLAEEFVETLLGKEDLRIERIVSRGHKSENNFWYDQHENEFVILLKGSAVLIFKKDNIHVSLTPGDYLIIPAHEKHRVERTSETEETVWITVFYSEKEQ